MLNIDDDLETALIPVKMTLAFYIGGMGSKEKNFHKDLMCRMGFEAEANKIQELFFEGRREEAMAMVPTQFADEISLCGSRARIKDRLQAWEDSPVTTLLVMGHGGLDMVRTMAELAL